MSQSSIQQIEISFAQVESLNPNVVNEGIIVLVPRKLHLSIFDRAFTEIRWCINLIDSGKIA